MAGVPRWLVIAVLAGLAVRLAAFAFLRETPPAGDEVEYLVRATAMAEGREILGEGKRPPASIWFHAAFMKVTGLRGADGRLANVMAGCVAIALVWVLARRFGGERTAAVSATAAALDPTLVLYSPSYWSEPLYLCLLLGALALVTRERPGLAGTAAAGALLAGAALTREVGVALPVVVAAAMLGGTRWRSGAAWSRAAVMAIAFVAALAPWVIRQNSGEETFAVVSRTTWLNLYVGNAPPPDGTEGPVRRAGGMKMYRAYDGLGANRDEKEAAAKEIALAAIRDRMPWWPAEKIAETMPDLLTPAPLPVGRLRNRPAPQGWPSKWAYRTPVDGTGAEWLRDAIAWAVVAGWIVVALTGAAGLALAWGRPLAGAFLLVILVHVLPVVISFAASRFRLPFVPILLITGSWLVTHGRAAWAEAGPGRRAAAVAATALTAWAIAADWHEFASPRWT